MVFSNACRTVPTREATRDAAEAATVKRRGPDLEWWVEVWDWETVPAQWQFHSTHATKAEAFECCEQQFELHGSVWRVKEVASWPIKEIR